MTEELAEHGGWLHFCNEKGRRTMPLHYRALMPAVKMNKFATARDLFGAGHRRVCGQLVIIRAYGTVT